MTAKSAKAGGKSGRRGGTAAERKTSTKPGHKTSARPGHKTSAMPGRKARARKATSKPGTERARDEQRTGSGPRYGGGPWSVADERGDQRFGRARNDDADPSELAPGEADYDDDDSPSAADPELADAQAAGEIESGGQRAGMGRGEKPRKLKARER
jgi:hypothetical protein